MLSVMLTSVVVKRSASPGNARRCAMEREAVLLMLAYLEWTNNAVWMLGKQINGSDLNHLMPTYGTNCCCRLER
jgi:hypothetical protein